jgi:hypothetical protein
MKKLIKYISILSISSFLQHNVHADAYIFCTKTPTLNSNGQNWK